MTYLQLINAVMLKLRENQVTVLTSNYSLLIGDLINAAKAQVETAWDWKCLSKTTTFNTVAGQETYDLTALVASGGAVTSAATTVTTERSKPRNNTHDKEPMVFCTTNGTRLTIYSIDDIKVWRGTRITATRQAPTACGFSRTNSGISAELHDPADATYAMSAEFIIRQADLSASTDVLLVPARPVILLAAAMATGERGSGKGQKEERLYEQADQALQQAMDDDMEGDEMDLISV
jgi:hypothetical protein